METVAQATGHASATNIFSRILILSIEVGKRCRFPSQPNDVQTWRIERVLQTDSVDVREEADEWPVARLGRSPWSVMTLVFIRK